MDFADASVVLLATGVHEILTADRRDFAVHLTSNSTQAPPRFAVMTGAVTTR